MLPSPLAVPWRLTPCVHPEIGTCGEAVSPPPPPSANVFTQGDGDTFTQGDGVELGQGS